MPKPPSSSKATKAMTIAALRMATREGASCEVTLHAQAEAINRKETAAGKPFYEVILRDSTDTLTLRAWSDGSAYSGCQGLAGGDFVEITGTFANNGAFGLDARGWEIGPLGEEFITELLEGSPEQQESAEASYQQICQAVASISDPRLKILCEAFLEQYGTRFRRSAAARHNHHARRGGLLDHTARMMQSALALLPVYPNLNRDLLVAGVLFHDTGKLWETCPPERGFGILPEMRGELLGHLSIGIELVNALWRELPKKEWEALEPASEQVRLHLLHLIAAHHGQREFGSPVLPKTPEAMALHLIDNFDARMEMFEAAYARSSQSPNGICEHVRPLGVSPIATLPKILPVLPKDLKTT